MKSLILIFQLFILSNAIGQLNFLEHTIIESIPNIGDISDMGHGDIDGDGDMDIVWSDLRSDRIFWSENVDGMGEFRVHHVIVEDDREFSSIDVSDFDLDGDLDILATSALNDKVVWYENLDGNGFYSQERIITLQLDGASQVSAVDLDNDGDMDVLASGIVEGAVGWFENVEGNMNFSSIKMIDSFFYFEGEVVLVDIDADGDMDVIIAGFLPGFVRIYSNNGTGNFDFNQGFNFVTSTLSTFRLGDIDGDGDLDIITEKGNLNGHYWIENDGNGRFETEHLFLQEGADLVFVTDVDGDNDMDILFCVGDTTDTMWIENIDGHGAFESPRSLGFKICSPMVLDCDIDGDGDKDLVFAQRTIEWYENEGDAIINYHSRVSGYSTDFVSIFTSDIDGDGDMDVASVGDGDDMIAWHENIGGSQLFENRKARFIANDKATIISLADIDGDELVDVVTGSPREDNIRWYRNMGGLFDLPRLVTHNAKSVSSIDLSDIDGDGDVDVLFGAKGADLVAWKKNTNGIGEFAVRSILSNEADEVVSVITVDLDGDGYLDVVSASRKDNKVAWYKNIDGEGNFTDEIIISNSIEKASKVLNGDLDGDSDEDVIVVSEGIVFWYENIDGLGTFGSKKILSSDEHRVNHIAIVDIDLDGDLDVISSGINPRVAWFENIENGGSFEEVKSIIENQSSVSYILSNDMDGDGDPDVLCISNDKNILWYENLLISSIEQPILNEIRIYPNPSTGPVTVSIPESFYKGELVVLDIDGHIVYSREITQQTLSIDVNLGFLPSGHYNIELYPTDNKEWIFGGSQVVLAK